MVDENHQMVLDLNRNSGINQAKEPDTGDGPGSDAPSKPC